MSKVWSQMKRSPSSVKFLISWLKHQRNLLNIPDLTLIALNFCTACWMINGKFPVSHIMSIKFFFTQIQIKSYSLYLKGRGGLQSSTNLESPMWKWACETYTLACTRGMYNFKLLYHKFYLLLSPFNYFLFLTSINLFE